MKRRKKQSISLRQIYFSIVGVVFLVSLIAWQLGTSKEEPSKNNPRRPEGYKSSLTRLEEINAYIKMNNISDDELQRINRQKGILATIFKYEIYIPFATGYEKIQNDLVGSPELIEVRDKLTNFAAPVYEKMSIVIDDPSDANLQDFSRYMVSLKPDIENLIRMIDDNTPDDLKPKARTLITKNLNKLLKVIDSYR